MSYFPLDREILSSSIWIEASPTQLKVWLFLLLQADPRTGILPDADPSIAHRCGLTIEETQDAIEWLASPDPHSRTKDNDGRRVERTEEGRVRVLNYENYRDKDYSTPRVKKWRERKKQDETEETRSTVTETTDTDTDTDTDTEEKSAAPIQDSSVSKADLVTQELVSEINKWLPDQKLVASTGLCVFVANLLLCGHAEGVWKVRGDGVNSGCSPGELLDAAHGFIVAECWDDWHARQRLAGKPVSFVRLLLNPTRLEEYAACGRTSWDKWLSEVQTDVAAIESPACQWEYDNHESSKIRMGPNWACPDKCGWYRRVTEKVPT